MIEISDKIKIRRLLEFCIKRGEVASESCNQTHILAVINQIRGALWYATGSDPGCAFDDLEDVAKFLELDYTMKENEIHFKLFPDL